MQNASQQGSKLLIKKRKMGDFVETKPLSGSPTNSSATTARKIVRDAKK